jgi:hypothetical protein
MPSQHSGQMSKSAQAKNSSVPERAHSRMRPSGWPSARADSLVKKEAEPRGLARSADKEEAASEGIAASISETGGDGQGGVWLGV